MSLDKVVRGNTLIRMITHARLAGILWILHMHTINETRTLIFMHLHIESGVCLYLPIYHVFAYWVLSNKDLQGPSKEHFPGCVKLGE